MNCSCFRFLKMSLELGDHGSTKLGSSSSHPGMKSLYCSVCVVSAIINRAIISFPFLEECFSNESTI